MYRNVELCAARGLPKAGKKERPSLAVVGGGKSAAQCLDELRAWDGDVWACGSTFQWLEREGIHAVLFCVDPQPGLAQMAVGATKALLASNCDPSAFDVLEQAGAYVETFDLIREDAPGISHGPTTASAAFDLSLRVMGYTDVSFFGFDSCYTEEEVKELPEHITVYTVTHIHKNEPEPNMVRIVCNGKAFITCAEFFMQAQWMSQLFRSEICKQGFIKNRSGGLLAAMVADPEYDFTHGSARVMGQQEAA